ncbi:MAG TPA: hypothetical protein VFR09_04625 [Alphaproteobacteria bacterium]|nr:hypothetical protein [Alphaproteobacteria bacterium]
MAIPPEVSSPVLYMFGNPTLRPQFILMIGDDGAFVVPHGIKPTVEPFFVAHDDEKNVGIATALFNKHPKAQVTLFADMLAQDFRREALPRLNPLDRPKLINRRLQQAFPHARLRASFNLKSSRAHILMAGLHEKSPLFDWMERLRHRLPRICLLPVEGAEIVMRILPDAREGWAMMLSRERTGGFRQIVTHQGELIFTRLTPPLPATAKAPEIAEAVQRDITASLGYLARLGLADTSKLRVTLLAPDDMQDELGEMRLPVHSLTLLSPHKVAKHLRLPFVPYGNDAFADLVFAGHLALKRCPRLSLMTPAIREAYWHSQIKKIGQHVAALVLIIALGSVGFKGSDLMLTLLATHKETAQLDGLHKKLAETQAEAAPLTEPLGKLRQAYERQRLFAEPTPTPWPALTILNHALGDDARLTKLTWQNDSGKPNAEVLQIEARLANLAPADSERESVMGEFQRLTQNVASMMPDYAVTLSRAPFPATPQEPVTNETQKGATLITAELTIRKKTP